MTRRGMREALRMFGAKDPQREPGESADRARTRRNKDLLERGIHPATRRALADNGKTCGDCQHSGRQGGTSGHYFKCAYTITRGPATDIRIGWPACTLYEEPADG